MSRQLIDYSAGVPSARAVKEAGFVGAIRYVSPARDAWMKGKPIRKAEADDYKAHGLEIVSIYQNLKEDWRRGRTGGVVDATDAISHHLEAGGPKGAVIYCAIDSNPSLHEYNTIARQYIEGFWDTLVSLGYRKGVYCNTKVFAWLKEDGLSNFLWWKHGWGSDSTIEGAALHQYEIDKFSVDGIKVDRNIAYAEDYGQWSKVGAQPAPAPAPKKEKPVVEYQLTGNQFPCDVNIWCPNSGTRDPFAIQYAVFHTTENGDTATARGVATWQQNPANGSSYNLLFDNSGETVRTNDDNRIPWAAGQPGSAKGIHSSFVGQAARSREHWFRFPKQLESAARWAADMHLRYGIPFVWLSPADIKAKKRGFTSHGNVYLGDGGPAYRSDPGAGFPHDWVLNRALEMVSGPKDPNAFPLPKGWYYGPLSGPNESISGEFGTELPAWKDGLKRWQAAVGIPETVIWDEATMNVATELQKEKGWPNNPNWADINGGFGGVYEGEWNAVIQEGWKPGPKNEPVPTPKPDPAPRDPELVTPPDASQEYDNGFSPVVTGTAKGTRKVRDLTGPGITTKWKMEGTDLGIPIRTGNGDETMFIFGDTFAGAGVGVGGDWRSPVGLFSKTANPADGVTWDRAVGPKADYASRLLNYEQGGSAFSTVLPSDILRLPDGTLVMHVMVNKGLGTVLWTELQFSTDNGVTWKHAGLNFPGDANGGFRQLWSFDYDPDDGYVYAMSTGFQRNKGLILHRVKWEEMLTPEFGVWEPWGYANGKWAWGNPATVILGDFGNEKVNIGEFYLRRLDTGFWNMTFFNAGRYAIDTMSFSGPVANMFDAYSKRKTLVRGGAWGRESDTQVAQLYCGAPIPGSSVNDWHFVVSQWNTGNSAAGPAGWPYRSMQFVGSIPVPAGYIPKDIEPKPNPDTGLPTETDPAPKPEVPVPPTEDVPAEGEAGGQNPTDSVVPPTPMDTIINLILRLFGLR